MMKLVGATNWVHPPAVSMAEGLLQGLVGSALVAVVVVLLANVGVHSLVTHYCDQRALVPRAARARRLVRDRGPRRRRRGHHRRARLLDRSCVASSTSDSRRSSDPLAGLDAFGAPPAAAVVVSAAGVVASRGDTEAALPSTSVTKLPSPRPTPSSSRSRSTPSPWKTRPALPAPRSATSPLPRLRSWHRAVRRCAGASRGAPHLLQAPGSRPSLRHLERASGIGFAAYPLRGRVPTALG